MSQQIQNLNIGDEIGFVKLGASAGEADSVTFFPVAEITRRDGERAYRYLYPDGEISSAAIRQSQLSNHTIRVRRTTVETIAPVNDRMLNLSERKAEFVEATQRGKDGRFEVYGDWDRDAYVVVNRENKAEYRVKLDVRGADMFFAECECPDFVYRKRICKHIAETVLNGIFSVNA